MGAQKPSERAVALGPLRLNLIKIERKWADILGRLMKEASEHVRVTESKHRQQRRDMLQRLRASRDELKGSIPLGPRLEALKASRDRLLSLGRVQKAEKVRRKLEPLLKRFWTTALKEAGFIALAKQEQQSLLEAQQAELASLRRELRRRTELTERQRDAELKARRRRNQTSSDDVWSIWYAAKHGDTRRLSKLLAPPNECKVDGRDPDSAWTALHFASRQGKSGAVQLLLDRRAFVGAKAPDGRTALHLAAGWGTYEVCLLLLQAGADKDARDEGGLTAGDLAESKGRAKVATILRGWYPIGLTSTETEQNRDFRESGSFRPWESEDDPGIRGQLLALEMKREVHGGCQLGTAITLDRLANFCRNAGRLQDARQYAEQLVELLRKSNLQEEGHVSGDPAPTAEGDDDGDGEEATRPERAVLLATALLNLGVVLYELDDKDHALGVLEESREIASSTDVSRGNAIVERLVQSIARNLGLAYLSEGKAEEARPLLRSCLEALERELRPDMSEGDECVELIEPLMLLSYTDMLAGDHVSAREEVERARQIAANRREYRGRVLDIDELGDKTLHDAADRLSDPVPRLEWVGVQRFAAGQYSDAAEFFTKARRTLVHRLATAYPRQCDAREHGPVEPKSPHGDVLDHRAARDAQEMKKIAADAGQGRAKLDASVEFDHEAMRLDRCAAVAICRRLADASRIGAKARRETEEYAFDGRLSDGGHIRDHQRNAHRAMQRIQKGFT